MGGINQQWQADLIDVRSLKQYNDKIAYLLTVIDVFSKQAYVIPLENKTGQTLINAFKSIFAHKKPIHLQTDKGSEFINVEFQRFLKREKVGFFTTENDDIKASIAERFNRTIKEKIWKYFTAKDTKRYIDVLPALVQSYNRSYHRSIKRAPVDVNYDNQEEVWKTLYNEDGILDHKKAKQNKFQIGDRVRISKTRRQFKKGYLPSWSDELFTVSEIQRTEPVTYIIKDDHGEPVLGAFYTPELQKVADKEVYKIDHIIRHKKDKKNKILYLVRWFGYDSSFDSWIPQSSLTKYS